MALLRYVLAYPPTGFPDRPWHEDPDIDAFLATSRAVLELYCAGLPDEGITAAHSEVRLFVDDPPLDGCSRVRVEADPPREGFDPCRVAVPLGFSVLKEDARLRGVLALVDATLTDLARRRGWPLDAVARLRARVAAGGLRFAWASPWTPSPDRRHRARAVFRMAADGWGRVQLEVAVDDDVVARTPEAVAFSTHAGWLRSADTLAWTDAGHVEMVPWSGLIGMQEGELEVDLSSPPLAAAVRDAPVDVDGPTPPVSVTDAVPPTPQWLHLRGIGGSDAYCDELQRVVAVLAADRAWLSWWVQGPYRSIALDVFGVLPGRGDARAPGARKVGEDLVLRVVGDLTDQPDDEESRRRARVDVHGALVDVAAARRLKPPPPLPDDNLS